MEKEETLINDLTEGSVLKGLVKFTLPFLAANMLQIIYSLVDMVFVGHANGSIGLSAVSIGSQVTIFCTQVGSGLTVGSQVALSQMVGAKQRDKINAAVGTSLTFFSIFALVITLIGVVFCRPVLLALNTPEEAMLQATQYLMVCCLGMFFIFGYNALCAILRGLGDSVHPLIFVTIASLMNVVLDFLFVVVMKTGAFGAALATVLGQMAAFIYALVFLYRRKEQFGFDFRLRSFAMQRDMLVLINKLGIPLAFQNVAVSFSMLYVNAWINTCGIAAVATAGIGHKVQGIMAMLTSAFSASNAALVGQNFAAGKQKRAVQVVWYSWGICMAFGLLFAGIFLATPKLIFRCFTTDPEVLALAPSFLRTCIVMVFAFALMSPVIGFINGVGNSTFNMVIGIIDGVFGRVGLSLLFGHVLNWGLNGYYLGNGLAGYISVVGCSVYFFSGRWKKRTLLTQNSKSK